MGMRKRQLIAFLLAVCLAVSPVLNVGALAAGAEGGTKTGTEKTGTATIDCSTTEGWEGNLTVSTDSNGLVVDGTSLKGKTATKSLGDLPDMTTASVSFDWYTKSLKSGSSAGRPGITLMAGETKVISVYMGAVALDTDGNPSAETTNLYYCIGDDSPSTNTDEEGKTTYGTPIEEITGKTIKTKEANKVSISIDFEQHTATISIGNEQYVTANIVDTATKIDAVMLNMAYKLDSKGKDPGNTYTVAMGLNNFTMAYTEAAEPEPTKLDIVSLVNPADATVKAEDWSSYTHPAKVTATLDNGSTAELSVSGWECEGFNVETSPSGTYTWTGTATLPNDGSITNTNNVSLAVTYTMNYTAAGTTEPDPGPGAEPDVTLDCTTVDGWTGTLTKSMKVNSGHIVVDGQKLVGQTATKSLGNLPEMTQATVAFDWYTTKLQSESNRGRPGVTLMDGDVEVVSVYMGEARDKATAATVYSSVYGEDPKELSKNALKVSATEPNKVVISIDFTTRKATVTINGTKAGEADINAAAAKVDTVMLNMARTTSTASVGTYTVNMGLGGFEMNYTEGTASRPAYIKALADLPVKEVTKEQWETGEAHPTQIEATLSNGTKQTLTINASAWSPDKTFDVNSQGTYTWTAEVTLPDGITNPLGLKANYTMNYASDFLGTDIESLGDLPSATVTKVQYTGGYQHPATVSAKLVNGTVITVRIDSSTWACAEFDQDTMGAYVWTANIIAPDGNRNHRNLKASYTMNYYADYQSAHDYENDFTFQNMDWAVWGKDIDSGSGSAGYSFEIKQEENGNFYLLATRSGSSPRGSRLNLSTDIVKGATIEFDWNPVEVTGRHADLLFISPAAKQNYLTIYVDPDGTVKYYTKSDCVNSGAAINNDFSGVIEENTAKETGITGAINKWFNVKIEFDYMAHTARLTITPKEGGEAKTVENIPISPDANGLSVFLMRYPSKCTKSVNALDNICVDYQKFDAGDIVSLKNPAEVNITKASLPYTFPESVTVKQGDGKERSSKVTNWRLVDTKQSFKNEANADNTPGTYTWTADLVLTSSSNYFDLHPTLIMNYSDKPYVVSAYNPPTEEVKFGTAWTEDNLPGTVSVALNTGEVLTDAKVGEWTAVRAFESDKEGIYVYGANLLDDKDASYTVDRNKLIANENHNSRKADGSSYSITEELEKLFAYDQDKFKYDVYYRVSYYKPTAGNYNGYTRSMEGLDRGVSAVTTSSGILVSWRMFVDEYGQGVQYNVLRNGTKINSSPITTKTNYLDSAGKAGDEYSIQTIKSGAATVSGSVKALSSNYLSIPVQKPEPQPDVSGDLSKGSYSLNDAGVADVDGDGQYEIVVKWLPANAFDSGSPRLSSPTIFDFYEMDGTPLWRLNLGLEMPSGAHFNQFMFYDLDEDGKAEFFIKTSDGTVTYKPNADGKFDMTDKSTIVSYVGDPNVVPGSNLRTNGVASEDSNEYVSVFSGLTGEEISTIPYVNEVKSLSDYGDSFGNRASRFNIAIAYLPKSAGSTETIPAVLLNRGYYQKTTVAAYTLRNGELTLEWNFDTDDPGKGYAAGKGNHNMSTGDMDQDGFDELVIGALALDHDGSILWCKDGVDGQDYQGHADAIHLTPMNQDNPTQLYVFTPSEEAPSTLNGTLSNAANGSRINGIFSKPADIGRGVAANITPKPGFEFWVNQPNSETDPRGSLFNMKGEIIATNPPSNMSTNWVAYWDGDLLSELADSYNMARNSMAQCVYKYDWETNELTRIANFAGTRTNNSTKNTPCLSADLFGDWREEFMVRNEDDTELRIYMTDYETEYAIYTLMQDPVYRNAVANQNTAYNQPPRVGFYLGEDNRDQVLAMGLLTPNIRYTATISETPSNPETPDNPGTPGSSSNPSTTTPPVTTNTANQGGSTTAETTAKPSATTKGDTATAAVNSTMGDEIVNQAVKNESATVVIAPEVKGDVSRIEASIPVSVANEIGDKTNANLTVSTPVGNVSIPNQALTELGTGSENLTVSLEKVSDAVSVDVSVDGKSVDAVPGGIKAAIPIKDGQVAVIVDADGNETIVRKSLVEDGVAYMVLDGSATVKVVDKETEYSDVDNGQWFSGAVEFASSHELFRGTSEHTFAPNAPMNRAMLATVLWRLEGETAPSSAAAFQDVADGTWYTESVAWASENGIITGTGNGSFSPTRDVTRQEMAVMLYRYAVKTGLDTTKKADIGTFADAGAVADWAKEAMEWAVAVGLIQGKGNSSIDATGAASRAQVATIFERLVKLQVK